MPSQEPVRSPVRLASAIYFPVTLNDADAQQRGLASSPLFDAAAIPLLRRGVQTHFCVWIV